MSAGSDYHAWGDANVFAFFSFQKGRLKKEAESNRA